MSCLGVHFAIDAEMTQRLTGSDNDSIIEIIQKEIEEEWDREWLCDTDKAWDAIHRCLTDGRLEYENGEFPLNAVILGGKRLYYGDDYTVCLASSEDVPTIANAIEKISEDELRYRYFSLLSEDYEAVIGEEDFGYTWENLRELVTFFGKASNAGRAVIFTTDQ